MFDIDIEKIFSHNPNSVLNYRKESVADIDSLEYPNLGKLKFSDFIRKDLKIQNVFINKSYTVPKQIQNIVKDEDNVIILKDGNIIYENLGDRFNDIYINDFNSAFEEKPDVVLDFLKQEKNKLKQNKLTAFNRAYLNSGILIDIPRKTSLDEIKLFYLQENADMIHRTVVIAGERSDVRIVEYFVNNTDCTANIVTDIFAKENAKVNYFSVDRFSREARVYNAFRSYVEKSAYLDVTRAVLSEANVISDTLINLVAMGAEVEVKSIAISENDQIQNINTETHHLAKNTYSQITNQGVSTDNSKLVFNNTGKIYKGMSSSKAFQTSRGIILSKKASLSANPFLLIDEYDVEAGHGATIGKFDDDSLFYLMSRGLTKSDAEKLIIAGFIAPILDGIENEFLKEEIKHIIDYKLREKKYSEGE
ncbi:SufD family Fe-S cluster assembly protein [Mycoplasmatota bacterium zrk1]